MVIEAGSELTLKCWFGSFIRIDASGDHIQRVPAIRAELGRPRRTVIGGAARCCLLRPNLADIAGQGGSAPVCVPQHAPATMRPGLDESLITDVWGDPTA